MIYTRYVLGNSFILYINQCFPVQITNCAHQVLEAAYKQKVQEVVVHSLSNNGAILYQHLTQLVMAEYQDITIKVEFIISPVIETVK